MEKTNDCIGSCCENFNLPLSPKDIKSSAEAQRNGKSEYLAQNGLMQDILGGDGEIIKLDDMLIFKRWTSVNPVDGKKSDKVNMSKYNSKVEYKINIDSWLYRNGLRVLKSGVTQMPVYTCKHHDKETKLCTNYKNRPKLCRNYPSRGGCEYKGCKMNCIK